MSDPADITTSTSTRRLVQACFGVFFILIAVVVVATSNASAHTGSIVLALVLGGLGLDALVSVKRRKRSQLSRIGPLP